MAPWIACGESTSDSVAEELRQLRRENAGMRRQLEQQDRRIQQLQRRMESMQERDQGQAEELESLRRDMEVGTDAPTRPMLQPPGQMGNVVLGGEGGIAFFHQDKEGRFDNAEFRVDEARLFLDAMLREDIYAFAELNLLQREVPEEEVRLGELYADFENLSRWWGQGRLVNLRIGRFDIPFGEEYLERDAVDNPLVTHSLPDFWGIDEGIELYGQSHSVSYVLAVQNGGHPVTREFTADKSVAGRIGYDPVSWLHLSGSAMRTGNLAPSEDVFSEMWFGNGFFRSLGNPATTTRFHANLFQGDVALKYERGHFKTAGGMVDYGDNDSSANNDREVYFYSVEGVHYLTDRLYGASRFSHILAEEGFPIVGGGEFGARMFGPLTESLWRWSVGVGYRWSPGLVVKMEYAMDRGTLVTGQRRDQEDLVGVELGFRF